MKVLSAVGSLCGSLNTGTQGKTTPPQMELRLENLVSMLLSALALSDTLVERPGDIQ